MDNESKIIELINSKDFTNIKLGFILGKSVLGIDKLVELFWKEFINYDKRGVANIHYPYFDADITWYELYYISRPGACLIIGSHLCCMKIEFEMKNGLESKGINDIVKRYIEIVIEHG